VFLFRIFGLFGGVQVGGVCWCFFWLLCLWVLLGFLEGFLCFGGVLVFFSSVICFLLVIWVLVRVRVFVFFWVGGGFVFCFVGVFFFRFVSFSCCEGDLFFLVAVFWCSLYSLFFGRSGGSFVFFFFFVGMFLGVLVHFLGGFSLGVTLCGVLFYTLWLFFGLV